MLVWPVIASERRDEPEREQEKLHVPTKEGVGGHQQTCPNPI